jgi:hypothetical protein
VTDTKIYAKSQFYEEPFMTADTCTHFSKWNHDGKKAAFCKEYTDEPTCLNLDTLGNMAGRSVRSAIDYDCTNGVKVYEKTDQTYTVDECTTICFNKHADWMSYGTST